MPASEHLARLLIVCAVLRFGNAAAEPNIEDTKPNVVIFLADDLGYGDLGCYGNDEVPTPNIDALATDGLKFSRMYSQPVCTPARAALLTGSHPVRHGLMEDTDAYGIKSPVFVSNAQPGGLACGKDTFLPQILKTSGYRNAMIGKWHLGMGKDGEHLPMNCGFDVFYGIPGSHCAGCTSDEKYRLTDHDLFVRSVSSHIPAISAGVAFLLTGVYMNMIGKRAIVLILACFCIGLFLHRAFFFLLHDNPLSCILMRNKEIIEQPYKDENMTLRMTNEAIEFISDTVQDKSPFFLLMSYLQPHHPSIRSQNFMGKSKQGIYYDSVMEIDWSVGVIVKRLQELSIKNNTLIIFSSDNGPEISNPATNIPNPPEMRGSTLYKSVHNQVGIELSGTKGSLKEGGIRVPAIISWPGHIPPGSQSNAVASLMDVFPTVQEILKIGNVNRFIDGKSLTAIFKDPGLIIHHELLLHFCEMSAVAAVSYGNYKLYYTTGENNHGCSGVMLQPPLLYNIAEDPGETTPLSVREYEPLLSKIHMGVIRQQSNILPEIVAQSSHFSRLPRPWLFPCANFPYCQISISEEQDYKYLFSNT
ncbi:steryl-sulfatase-like [Liolophura sinensis]|uniref:steryl-sulfatase-like n=1 Tax=Liolophura sinensis TaxID=3198878 RepID=UPI003158C97D